MLNIIVNCTSSNKFIYSFQYFATLQSSTSDQLEAEIYLKVYSARCRQTELLVKNKKQRIKLEIE